MLYWLIAFMYFRKNNSCRHLVEIKLILRVTYIALSLSSLYTIFNPYKNKAILVTWGNFGVRYAHIMSIL